MKIILNKHELEHFEKKFIISRRIPWETKDGLTYIGKWIDNDIFIDNGFPITSLQLKEKDDKKK